MSCESVVDYNTIAGVLAGVLFIGSELLALSKKTKANGIAHLILIYLEKKFRVPESVDPEYGAVPEYGSVDGDVESLEDTEIEEPRGTPQDYFRYSNGYNGYTDYSRGAFF